MSPAAEVRGTATRLAFWAGLAVAALAVAAAEGGVAAEAMTREAWIVAGVTAWMAIWWISEAVPIGASSLIPIAAFPLLGVAPVKEAVRPYMSPFIVLLMAGFMAALAIERWNLHRRLSLRVLLTVGTSPNRLVLGMMIAAALCSMWISNTATTLMMLPIGMALLARAEETGQDPETVARFGTVMFLGLAYAASVGGLGTPIGTPPNLIFLGAYHEAFPERDPITFVGWMRFGLPAVIVMVPLIWLYLTRVVARLPAQLAVGGRPLLQAELKAMGRMTRDERAVALIFGAMALAWVTRRVVIGDGAVTGWAPALGLDKLVDDSTVAVVGALLLFSWPSRTEPGRRLLDWETAQRIPWEVVLLFGGGLALAEGFKTSGLSKAIVDQLAGLADMPAPVLVLAVALTVTFLTEVTSNTATATILMPVLAAFAGAAHLRPELVMVPAVLSCSCAFMLPVATAPNAIVYGTGRVAMKRMARTGFGLNLVGAVVITGLAWLLF